MKNSVIQNQSIEIEPNMTEMMKLTDKDFITTTRNMFKGLKGK